MFTHFLTMGHVSMNIISQIMSNSNRQSENNFKLIPTFWNLGQIGVQIRGKPIFTHFLTMTDISMNIISKIMSNLHRQSENNLKLIPMEIRYGKPQVKYICNTISYFDISTQIVHISTVLSFES